MTDSIYAHRDLGYLLFKKGIINDIILKEALLVRANEDRKNKSPGKARGNNNSKRSRDGKSYAGINVHR